MIPDILSRKPIDKCINGTGDKASDPAPQRTSDDAGGEAKRIPVRLR
jgi:hypothetical protein